MMLLLLSLSRNGICEEEKQWNGVHENWNGLFDNVMSMVKGRRSIIIIIILLACLPNVTNKTGQTSHVFQLSKI